MIHTHFEEDLKQAKDYLGQIEARIEKEEIAGLFSEKRKDLSEDAVFFLETLLDASKDSE